MAGAADDLFIEIHWPNGGPPILGRALERCVSVGLFVLVKILAAARPSGSRAPPGPMGTTAGRSHYVNSHVVGEVGPKDANFGPLAAPPARTGNRRRNMDQRAPLRTSASKSATRQFRGKLLAC